MRYIAYTKNNTVILEILLSSQVPVDFEYIIIENFPTDPIESWYIEDGEIKIDQQKLIDFNRSQLIPLTKRRFNLYMFDNGLTDQINALFTNNPREKIEFDSTDKIERNSPTVQAMILALGWTDEQVDAMWEQALTI